MPQAGTGHITQAGEAKSIAWNYCHIAALGSCSAQVVIGIELAAPAASCRESRVTELPDKFLDLIYDAATERELWRSVLTEIADLTGSQGGVLFGQSVGASQVYFEYNGRLSEECNRVYQERHMQNPWSMGMETQPVGRIVLSDEIIPLSSLRSTLFFDEVLRPQNVAHNVMIALAAKDDFRAAFNLCRSARQGDLDRDGRRLLGRLVPHLQRSFLLGFRLDAYRALQHAEYHVLDRLSVGVILLDRHARIVYVNASARALEAHDGPLRLRGATVAAHSPMHSQRLGELIRMALRGAPAASMSVPRPSDGQLLTILVSSVRGRDVARFADLSMPDAAVLLFIIDPANRAGIPLQWIMDAYALTPAEAKVALAASSGLTIPEVALQLGLSPNTIKTHLRKVFAKTGSSRQAELARLIASIGLLKANSSSPPDGK
jgi:DNA-binding CsgD family transcriptional regulator/PAS domain-containing protein